MIQYYLTYLVLFVGLGAYNTFLPVYLENTLGFTSAQIGTIVSIPSIVGLIFLPLWGIISDLLKKQKTVLWFNVLMTFVFTLVYISTKSFLYVFIVAIVFETFRNSILPLTDSLTNSYCRENNKNYGSIRVIGSLFFAISAFLCGQLINATNQNIFFFYVFALSMALFLLIIPFLKAPNTISTKEKVSLKRDLPLLLKNKTYILIILCGLSLNALTEAIIPFQGIYLMNLGASAGLVGILTTVMVIPELFFMVKTKSLINKFGLINMLRFGSIALSIRWIVYYFTSNPWVFILATTMHGIAISIIIVCAYDLLSKIIDKKLFTTSMTLYTFAMGTTYSLLKLLYGNIIDIYGIKPIFIFSMIISLLSFIVFNSLGKVSSDEHSTSNI